MSYLQCRRCGLQIKSQPKALFLRLENCPRCLGRSETVSPLVESAEWTSPAPRWGGRHSSDRSREQHPRHT